jgi:hypothetical protein
MLKVDEEDSTLWKTKDIGTNDLVIVGVRIFVLSSLVRSCFEYQELIEKIMLSDRSYLNSLEVVG